MQSSFPIPPIPMESIVINELPSEKPTTTLLHAPHVKKQHHHHLYNYWTLNERLRSKNEKLSKIQQASCRFAFYSLWLFIFANVMGIIVYRFTADCPITTMNREHSSLKCLKNVLFLLAICIGFLACSGIIFGTCRYCRAQPRQLLYNDECELRLTQNYDLLPITNISHSCSCQRSLANSVSKLSSQQTPNHNDEHSNITVTTSLQNISPQRKIPPFTYEELPPTQTPSPPPLPPLPTSLNVNINAKPSNTSQNKSAFFSSSTSASSSPQSVFSSDIVSRVPNATISNDNNSNNNRYKSQVTFADVCSSTSPACPSCVCQTDVWERQ